jgi:hypothetical protein
MRRGQKLRSASRKPEWSTCGCASSEDGPERPTPHKKKAKCFLPFCEGRGPKAARLNRRAFFVSPPYRPLDPASHQQIRRMLAATDSPLLVNPGMDEPNSGTDAGFSIPR